uniref:Uncharacterized protein n=1 Tax=viral metagenome TaxID=1070528 RepID=A0A6C0KG92_9ZZZZ
MIVGLLLLLATIVYVYPFVKSLVACAIGNKNADLVVLISAIISYYILMEVEVMELLTELISRLVKLFSM